MEAESHWLEAFKPVQIYDSLPELEIGQITKLAASSCNAPIALFSLLNENRQWFISSYGFQEIKTGLDDVFWKYTILQDEVLEVADATQDDRFRDSLWVLQNPHIRFYAGHPFIDSQGNLIGFICVIDQKPGKLSDNQQNSLKLLAHMGTELIIKNREKLKLRQFKILFDLSNDLLCVAGTDGYFKEINPAFNKVLGWDETMILTTSFFDLVHPDDLLDTQQEIEKLGRGQATINFEHRFLCKDGTYRHLQWVATPDVATGLLYAIARDVTTEKQKEAELYYSESKFRSFYENSQGFMCIHDLEGCFLSVNQAGANSLGYESAELTNMRLFDIVPPTFHEQVRKYLVDIQNEGRSCGLLNTRSRKGVRQIWYYSNVLERDTFNKPFVIGNAIDITDRHKLEVELKTASEMLEQTNRVARIGAWEANLQHRTVFWSSMTKAIHELPEDYEPEFETAASFFKGPHYDRLITLFSRAVNEGVGFDDELQIQTAKGREVWVRAIGTPEFRNGKCIRVYGTFQEIDDRKKAEKELLTEKMRLAAFVEHAPAAVAMFNRNIQYLAFSKRWLEEYRVTQNIIGLSHYDVFPNITDDWKAIHQRCLNGEVVKCDEEIWQPPGWEQKQYLKWEVRPWYEHDGTVGGIMMFTQDITEVCLQKEELKKAKLLAENASKAKSEFLANMSHEIRTPLNGVIGFTDLVLKTNLNTTQHQYISIVNQSANTLLSIINDILDFSKIEAGKLELDITRSDLYEICSQAADIITYQVQNKGLEMLLNIQPNLPRFVYIDPVRLKQVLINLLGNAVKFTDQGEIELKITAKESNQGETLFRFEVRDTGIGIKPSMQSKIFEAFSQEDPSTTKKYGGTGLGLTISNKLLGLMGSQLQLESQLGKGSTFYFDIKCRDSIGEPIVWQDDISAIRNVLIADDNENNRIILRQMLLIKQIHVEEAANGFEVLKMLADGKKFDVVLLDYHMPFLNGLETAAKIRSHLINVPDDQPIILLHSSSNDGTIREGCERLGINHQLVKPIKMQELYSVLARLHQTTKAYDFPQTTSQDGKSATSLVLKILVVEDNRINLLLAKSILKRIAPNSTILEAMNGEEAIRFYLEEKPDIILMDVQMPVMNGFEATRKIRALEQDSHVPIIALTASSTVEEKQQCIEAGMDDFIAKPIVEESLAPVLFR